MKTLVVVFIALIIAWTVFKCTSETEKFLTPLARRLGPSPTAEFVKGFEAGVRYGLLAKIQNPSEDNIPALTDHAKVLYALIARGGWRGPEEK